MSDFKDNLFSFYQMIETADIFGAQQMSEYSVISNRDRGDPISSQYAAAGGKEIRTFYQFLLKLMIEADARGSYPIETLMKQIETATKNNFSSKNSTATSGDDVSNIRQEIAYAIRAYSYDRTLKLKNNTETTIFQDGYGYGQGDKIEKITSLKEVLNVNEEAAKRVKMGVVLATTPLITPQMRNTKKIEFFLNNMPSYFPSRMMPYFDIKFQFSRDEPLGYDKKNTAFGLLKFLEGANINLEGSANSAMYDGNLYAKERQKEQGNEDFQSRQDSFYRAGMEVFLSPQTLVNPESEGFSDRFVPVIDPYRPLATLVSADISIQPQIGFMTYKHGTLTFKIHDRSRLHEISDMIRPQLFKGTTLWITYGWRAPQEENPYSRFINDNMLMREAFMVVNSEFSFDTVGQVEVRLKIATQGARQAEIASLVGDDVQKRLQDIQQIQRRIQSIQQRLNLKGTFGLKNEVRALELLDHAARGTVPDLKKGELEKSILRLKEILEKAGAGGSEFGNLIDEVKLGIENLYKKSSNRSRSKEGNFIENLERSYEELIYRKFIAIDTTPDPWLHSKEKMDVVRKSAEIPEWAQYNEIINQYQYADDQSKALKSKAKSKNGFKKSVVSFGKLFSIFVGDAIAQQEEVGEIQLWFYKLNNHCGPASGINIAEFPIEMATFLRAYSDHVFNRRSTKITVKEFISLLVGTQVNDVRALPYGMRNFYAAYDPKNRDAKLAKGKKQKEFENEIVNRQKKYGVFKKPAIQVAIETVHAREDNTTASSIDLLELLNRIDAPDAGKFGVSRNSSDGAYKKIMRIHVYDKTVDPYPLQKNLLRDKTGGIFEIPSTKNGKAVWDKLMDYQRSYGASSNKFTEKAKELIQFRNGTSENPGTLVVKKHNVQPGQGGQSALQQLTEEISKRVPTIHYGSNGTTITQASLSTKSDPRVSTVNMIRPVGNQVTMQPNGAGQGNLPVRVIPATMTMTSLGVPLAHPAQLYYVEFGTGTTVDNLYILTHITHTFGPGKFETSWQFGYSDGYARYEAMPVIAQDFLSVENLVRGANSTST